MPPNFKKYHYFINKLQGSWLSSYIIYSELRYLVIAPPTSSSFWLQTLSFVLAKSFHFDSFLFVLLEPFSCVETNIVIILTKLWLTILLSTYKTLYLTHDGVLGCPSYSMSIYKQIVQKRLSKLLSLLNYLNYDPLLTLLYRFLGSVCVVYFNQLLGAARTQKLV